MHILVRSNLETMLGIGCSPCKCNKRRAHGVCKCKCGQEWDRPDD